MPQEMIFSFRRKPTGENPTLAFGTITRTGEQFRFTFKDGQAKLYIFFDEYLPPWADTEELSEDSIVYEGKLRFNPTVKDEPLIDCPFGSAARNLAVRYPALPDNLKFESKVGGQGRAGLTLVTGLLIHWLREYERSQRPSAQRFITPEFRRLMSEIDDPQTGLLRHASWHELANLVRQTAKLFRQDSADIKQWQALHDKAAAEQDIASRAEFFAKGGMAGPTAKASDNAWDLAKMLHLATWAVTAPETGHWTVKEALRARARLRRLKGGQRQSGK